MGGLFKGVLFAVSAYFLWGVLPIYWSLLAAVDSLHILALRILLSLLFVGAVLLYKKNLVWLAVFRDVKKRAFVISASLLISLNWGLFIWSVNNGRVIEASLGYYINPLVSVILGLIFFREKLQLLQWAAFGIAALGVLILTALSGTFPWISLALAFSFGFYALFKKKIKLSALESLGAETLAAAPLGILLFLCSVEDSGGFIPSLSFGLQGLSYFSEIPLWVWIPLALCGVVTALPLYLFSHSVKLLPLSVVGFTQFLAPTLQFIQGFFLFGEYFPTRYFIAFAFIWLAVIIFIISLTRQPRQRV